MWNTSKFGLILVVFTMLAAAIGCTKEVPPAVPSSTTTEDEPAALPPVDSEVATPADPADAAVPGTGDQSGDATIEAALASLSAADRAAALKQKICPVSDAALGSMGAPIKVSVAGHDVFICCEHCEEPLKAEPAKHLAKIGLQPADGAAVQ
jgi:hypothetical protein